MGNIRVIKDYILFSFTFGRINYQRDRLNLLLALPLSMVIYLLIFSFLIRLVGINQSLWLDEAISISVAKMPLNQIVSGFSHFDFHPPLYYWFLNIWIKIFGENVGIMRLSSVIFAVITIGIVYLIGKEIKDKKYGLWSALFVSINPLLIYYSQELRMYSMTTMWLTGAVYFLIKMIPSADSGNKISWKNILGFNLMTFLSFVTFYGSIFGICAMILYLLLTKKNKLFLYNSIGIICAMLVVSQLLISQLGYSGNMLNQVTNWGLVLGKVNIKNLLLIFLKFSIGRVSWYPKQIYYLIGGIWTLIVWSIVGKNILKNKLLSFLLVVPIIFGILFSIKSPLLQYFRFLYLIPVLSLILANNKKIMVKLLLALGFLVFSFTYLFNPKMHREDWKSLVESLDNNQKIYMIASFSDPIKFYNPSIEIIDIKTYDPVEKEITIVPYGGIIHGMEIKQKMEKLGYQQTEIKNFREIVLESWKQR